MNRESNSKTSLFLMELIISILFFSITGAVCVKLFVNAHVIAQHSVALTNAVMWAQNCSEAYTGCDGNLNDLSAIYPDCCVLVNEETPQKGTLLIFLDKNWKRISYPTDHTAGIQNAAYEVVLTAASESASRIFSCNTPADSTAIVSSVFILSIQNHNIYTTSIPDTTQNVIYTITADHYTGGENQ